MRGGVRQKDVLVLSISNSVVRLNRITVFL